VRRELVAAQRLRHLLTYTLPHVAGAGRIVSAAPEVATALEYDIEAALEEPDDH
jgi:hypothetical protein